MKKNLYKIDLHTHSTYSPYGGISEAEYDIALQTNILHQIAITDYNHIDFALFMNKKHPKQIIVGQEIITAGGHLIGLFLKEKIPDKLSIKETINRIKIQKGLVYLPYLNAKWQGGIPLTIAQTMATDFNICEVFNAREWGNNTPEFADNFVLSYDLVASSSSNAHGFHELATTYTLTFKMLTRKNCLTQLKLATSVEEKSSWLNLLTPFVNRLRNLNPLD